MLSSAPQIIALLDRLEVGEVQRFLRDIKKSAGYTFGSILECLDSRGPVELYGPGGDGEGLAFGILKHASIQTVVTNSYMGELRVMGWLSLDANAGKSREEAIAALTGDAAVTSKGVLHMRRDCRNLIAHLCSRIEEGLLLTLGQDKDFETARTGSCVVTFVEALRNRAANATLSKRADAKAARTRFEDGKMGSKDYHRFKFQTNENYADTVRAGAGISIPDAVETIVGNLNKEVFPTLYRDLLSKHGTWTGVKDLPEMWKIVDSEYTVFKTMNPEQVQEKEGVSIVNRRLEHEETSMSAFMINQKRLESKLDSIIGEKRKLDNSNTNSTLGNLEFCHNFARYGRCTFKDKCRFKHEFDLDVLRKGGYRPRFEDFWSVRALDNREKNRDVVNRYDRNDSPNTRGNTRAGEVTLSSRQKGMVSAFMAGLGASIEDRDVESSEMQSSSKAAGKLPEMEIAVDKSEQKTITMKEYVRGFSGRNNN
jgi:hypothetical protein